MTYQASPAALDCLTGFFEPSSARIVGLCQGRLDQISPEKSLFWGTINFLSGLLHVNAEPSVGCKEDGRAHTSGYGYGHP